jgi:hypothetical protein
VSVVEFKPRVAVSDDADRHIEGPAFCGACGHKWQGAVPVGEVHLECPECKRYWGLFENAIEPKVAWRCDCGEHLFWLVPEGVQCRKCGEFQVGWF